MRQSTGNGGARCGGLPVALREGQAVRVGRLSREGVSGLLEMPEWEIPGQRVPAVGMTTAAPSGSVLAVRNTGEHQSAWRFPVTGGAVELSLPPGVASHAVSLSALDGGLAVARVARRGEDGGTTLWTRPVDADAWSEPIALPGILVLSVAPAVDGGLVVGGKRLAGGAVLGCLDLGTGALTAVGGPAPASLRPGRGLLSSTWDREPPEYFLRVAAVPGMTTAISESGYLWQDTALHALGPGGRVPWYRSRWVFDGVAGGPHVHEGRVVLLGARGRLHIADPERRRWSGRRIGKLLGEVCGEAGPPRVAGGAVCGEELWVEVAFDGEPGDCGRFVVAVRPTGGAAELVYRCPPGEEIIGLGLD
ncbi:hypothetical protein ACFYNO_34960 [Kitasatospora sp. NPDC006697]|uniref:hypothetical protein n=1 Tax=Kitasatospora sp. NPDC006697 TaxID=3364020 RepID=UPI0036991AB6